jgi:hypothetical protein
MYNWITTDKNCLQNLSFADFMSELYAAYLDANWEEKVQHEMLAMTQGMHKSFWDSVIHVQAKNSLLLSTGSHLDEERLCYHLEAGMAKLLSHYCIHHKTNKITDFKDWLQEVKSQDLLMQAGRKEFQSYTHHGRMDSHHQNPLAEPSRNANKANTSTKLSQDVCRLPHLMEQEHQLLFNNDGCLKCHRFFAEHLSANCDNDFLNLKTYNTLIQADMEKTRHSAKACLTAAIFVKQKGEDDEDSQPTIHLVAAVIAMEHPTAYIPANVLDVVEGDSGSDDDVSPHYAVSYPSELAMLHGKHLFWNCASVGREGLYHFAALIDNSSYTVLI